MAVDFSMASFGYAKPWNSWGFLWIEPRILKCHTGGGHEMGFLRIA
jgi:hypothetical protein